MPDYSPNLNIPLPLSNETVNRLSYREALLAIDTGAAAAADVTAHLADTMPHRFVDGGVTYRWGLAVINGVVNMVYEEVV